MQKSVSQPISRVDGRQKVTGAARFSADTPVPNLVHGVIVTSTIARGRIQSLDTRDAERVAGVLAVMTHLNTPELPRPTGEPKPIEFELDLLQSSVVRYANQPIAVVVADTLERAIEAAERVRVRYQQEPPASEIRRELPRAYTPKTAGPREKPDSVKGDVAAGMAAAGIKVEQTYTTPTQTHNPMEPHATVAAWDGPRLTLYDATQGVYGDRQRVANLLGIPPDNVRVVCPFVGGGFGAKGPTWSHVVLAAMAARRVGRPVKLVVRRQQMFGMLGFRSETIQKLALGAAPDGALTAARHDSTSQTSVFDEFAEPAALPTRMMYASPHIATTHRLVRLNTGTPSFMRAPGEAPGMYALECAMDELAYALKVDPVELRLRNHSDVDPDSGKPWSSKSLKECYRLGAERFQWAKRNPEPRSMRAGRLLVGWGMATATYPVRRSPASAVVRLRADGTALAQAATHDLGTGTYTTMTQIAADALGLPLARVRFELGDTDYPENPVSGGSQTSASTGSAVHVASLDLRRKLVQMTIADAGSPLQGAAEGDIDVDDGRLFRKGDPSRGETYQAILARRGLKEVEARLESRPGEEQQKYSMHSFGAQFAEVQVDPDLGQVRVTRFTGAFGAGRILNAKTARSQFIGGSVWGISMALHEHTVTDPRYGRYVNNDLAEYHIPVNADIPDIDAVWVDEQDPHVNPLGVKGIGEIGITGAAAAVANAVYHATGKRVRDLPITLDKLL